MEALPFTLKNKPGEAGSISGLCRLDDDALSIEWKKTSLIDRHARTGDLRIQLDQLEFVKYKWGFFSARFVVRPRSLQPIAEFPGAHPGGELHLRVARADRAVAKELASSIDFALSDHRMDRLGRSIGL